MSDCVYIQYSKCKAFKGENHAGRLTEERNTNGEIVKCCLGAYDEPTEWASICKECLDCPKYIRKVRGDL